MQDSLSGGGGVLDELSENSSFLAVMSLSLEKWIPPFGEDLILTLFGSFRLGLATFHLSYRLLIKLKHLHMLASTSFIVHG